MFKNNPSKKNNLKKSDRSKNMLTAQTKFVISEAYKELRANLNFAVPKVGCKTVMITSSYSGEGKTTTAVNLAIAISQTNSNVLLIDCDMRKPRIHDMFGIKSTLGLSNYLSNMTEVDEIVLDTSRPSLKIITAGSIPPNPGELLAADRMVSLLTVLSNVFDYIIIDTPPVGVVADALPIAKICDGVVIVVKPMQSTHPELSQSIDKLHFAEANIIGVVVNGIDISHNIAHGKYTGKYYKNYKNYDDYSDSGREKLND